MGLEKSGDQKLIGDDNLQARTTLYTRSVDSIDEKAWTHHSPGSSRLHHNSSKGPTTGITFFRRSAKRSVLSVSSSLASIGLTLQQTTVYAVPPNESCGKATTVRDRMGQSVCAHKGNGSFGWHRGSAVNGMTIERG